MKARLAAFLVVLSMIGAAREAAATIGNTPPGEALTISNTGSPNFTQGATGCTSTSVSFDTNSFVTCNSGAWAVQPVQIGTASSAPFTCSSTYAGMMYENSATNAVQYCNGSTWTTLASSGSSVSGSGSTGYDAIWTSPTAIGTGLLYESGGNVGIGTASPSSTLQIGNTIVTGNQGTYTADQFQINDAPTATAPANSPIIAQYIAMQPAPASNSSVKYEGQNIDVNVPSSTSVTYSSVTGSQSGVTYAGGGSVASNGTRANGNKHGLTGGYGVAQNSSSSATVGEAVGYLGVVNNNSTGTITFASGLAGSVSNNSTGTISNAYGVYSAADTNGAVGTITNGYGVYISGWGSVGGTWTNTPYDVYASDTTAYNYFAGNVGIGTTSPGARTEIDTGAAGTVGLLIKGASGQTANLLNITDTFGNLYLAVSTTQILGHEPIVASDFGIHSGVSYDLKIVNTTDIELLNSSSGTIPFYATGAGYVGIGITSPAALLNLGGNISASSWTTTGIDFATNAATYTDTSTAAAGTVTTRAVNSLGLPTLASTNAITVTNGSNLYIAGGAAQGTNTTLTNSYGEYIAAGAVGASTNSYGLYVNAQTGATNNYAAVFASGNVGIGTTSPQSKLQISGGEVQVGSSGLSCTSNNAGAISYSSGALNYCNGSAWTSAGSGGGSGLPSGASQYQMIREGTSAPQWENAPYDVASFMPSTPIASSFINIVLPRNIQLPSGLPSSQCIAITAATASTTVTINKISGGTTTAEGTAVWAASAKTCTFTFSSAISFAAGDMVQFSFPSPADATLANVSITLAGIRQ